MIDITFICDIIFSAQYRRKKIIITTVCQKHVVATEINFINTCHDLFSTFVFFFLIFFQLAFSSWNSFLLDFSGFKVRFEACTVAWRADFERALRLKSDRIQSVWFSGKDHRIQHDRPPSRNGHNSEDGLKISAASLLLSKLPERPVQQLSSASLQSAALQPQSWQTTTTTWLRSSPFSANGTADGRGAESPGHPDPATAAATNRAAEAAEQRRKLLVELSAFKSRLVELHLRREEVDREVSVVVLCCVYCNDYLPSRSRRPTAELEGPCGGMTCDSLLYIV